MFLKSMPIFIGVITFILFMKIRLKKSDNGYDKSVDDFLDREAKANSITKKFDTLNLKFIKPNKNLPFKQYEDIPKYKKIIKKQNLVMRKLDLEMIKIPSNLSNTEMKEIYGVNNFEKISILEEHYNSFVRALFEWATELFNLNNIYDCKIILLEASNLDANISQVYTLLAKIYLKENDKTSLLKLKEKVNNMELSLKDKALKEIEEYINSLL